MNSGGGNELSIAIEDYALIGDCHTAALVSNGGAIDWLCLPHFDSAACFAALVGTPDNGHWTISPAEDIRSVRRRYREDTLVLETEFETASGTVLLIDFMTPPNETPDLVRLVVGKAGKVPMRMELIIRFDYGSIVPWVERTETGISAIAGPDMVSLRTTVPLRGEDLRTVAEFAVGAGERVAFDLTWYPSTHYEPSTLDIPRALERHRNLVARLVSALFLPGKMARRGREIPDHTEGPDLHAIRRNCRRSHHLASRANRRRAQLGLPLLLGPRRHPHPGRSAQCRIRRRSQELAGMAASCGGRASFRGKHRLRHPWRAPSDGDGASLAGGISRVRRPCGSATRPTVSFNSIFSARSRTLSSNAALPESARWEGAKEYRWLFLSFSKPPGKSLTKAFGKSADHAAISRIPR